MMEAVVDRVARRIGATIAPPPIPPEIQAEADALWRTHLGRRDLGALREEFHTAGEFLVIEDAVPAELCARALAEIDAANPARTGGLRGSMTRGRPTRSRVPWVRAAQHVGWRTLQRIAPLSSAIYRSPVFLDWMSELVGRPMLLKDAEDDHACATYEYERAGDGMRFHYDTCGCDEGASYTQLLALHDRSTQRLIVDLHTKDDQPVERRVLQTLPGTLVVFCGSKVWHGVSPLGAGERRVMLSMSYASNPAMPPWRRLYENVKDAVLYFGPTALLQRNFK